jgi:integrase
MEPLLIFVKVQLKNRVNMIKLNYSVRPYIKGSTGQVAVRVRWNQCKSEVVFFTNVWAESDKWNPDLLKAKRGTTHYVRDMKFTYMEINEAIAEYREEIENVFDKCALKNVVPTTDELKTMVNSALGRIDINSTAPTEVIKKKTFKEMIDLFLSECGREKNWDDQAKEKYTQAFQHITKANPHIKPDKISIEHMFKLRDWYIKNRYRNRTINKQITMLKGFLKWLNTKTGYAVPVEVLNFETNLKVLPKTVTFLHYDELLHFAHFNFENDENGRLSRARDFWCFMAFTSLRVSDLTRLKVIHIHEGKIEMFAKKTGEHLVIPLTDEAQRILTLYNIGKQADDYFFDVQSPQKLNDAVKDAARVAGLDRIITEIYFIGTERKEETHKFCEIISNHDARRTFVSCSLAMGIPAETVMKCTGHKSYNTMKPYIETATETQALEMEKWNKNQYRSQIINLLNTANEDSLRNWLHNIQTEIAQKS